MKKLFVYLVVFCFIIGLCGCVNPVQDTVSEVTTVSDVSEKKQCIHEKWYSVPDFELVYDHYTDTISYPCPKDGCNGVLERKPDELAIEVKLNQQVLEVKCTGGVNPHVRVMYRTNSDPFLWELLLDDVVSASFEYCGHGTFSIPAEDIERIEVHAYDETGRTAVHNEVYGELTDG